MCFMFYDFHRFVLPSGMTPVVEIVLQSIPEMGVEAMGKSFLRSS